MIKSILVNAARAHTEVHNVSSFIDQISTLEEGPTRDVLSRLLSLFALTTIVSLSANNTISFVKDDYLSHEQRGNNREHIDGLLDVLVPDAIALTDAWNFTDGSLASAIDCKDGNAHERIMRWTRQLPINVNAKKDGGAFVGGYEEHIKPFMTAKL